MRKAFFLLFTAFTIVANAQQHIDFDHTRLVKWDGLHPYATPSGTCLSPRKVDGLSSTQRPVGHIVANNPDSITIKGAMVGSAGTYPVGAVIGPDILDNYAGCKVVGIRMAAAQNLGKTNTFLYTLADNVLSDTPITKSQRLYEGWNNVFFNGDTSLDITEGMTLLVGYDYTETTNMVEAESSGLCTVGESNGSDFLIYANLGSGEGWYTVNNLGALCVQLIVDVSNLPQKALSLNYFDTGFRYKKAGERVEMYVIVGNIGREDINSYKLSCQLDDQAPVIFDYTENIAEQGSAHQQPVLTLPSDIAIGRHTLELSLLAEGETIAASDKAKGTATFFIYDQYLQRQKNYVEQYNSQDEYMASYVNPPFNQVANSNKQMVLVNVYKAGNPLAVEEAAYLHDLYAYTLPSFTVNRSYFPGEEYIAYDVNYYAYQYAAFVPTIIDDLIQQDLMQPAFATVNLSAQYDAETRQLTIDATGDLADGALDILGTPSLTLLLTENNITSPQVVVNKMTERISTQQDYTHQHVLRTFVTPALGTPVEVSGSQYTAHHSVTLDPSWNPQEMTLVGFISRTAEAVNDDNVLQMDITNCNSIDLKDLTGIHATTQDETTNVEYYLPNGQRVSRSSLKKSLYIVKQGGKTQKVAIK